MSLAAYPCADGIDDVSATAFKALAGVGDDDGELWILVEDLLYATIVAARLPARGGGRARGISKVIVAVRVAGMADMRGGRRCVLAGGGGGGGNIEARLPIYKLPVGVSLFGAGSKGKGRSRSRTGYGWGIIQVD